MTNDETLQSIRLVLPKVWRPIHKGGLSQFESSSGLSATGVDTTPVPITTTAEDTATPSNQAPQHVINLSATESPYKSKDGQVFSLVSVSFDRVADPLYGGVQIYFVGYSGSDNPTLMPGGSESPVSFLVPTTNETVTVVVVAVSNAGVPASFDTAPRTTVVLDGMVSPPPAPTILDGVSALAGGIGWQFRFNVLNGLLDTVIAGYWVYSKTGTGAPTPADRFRCYPQPASNIGIMTVQEITSGTKHYWISSLDVNGLEGTPVEVPASGAGPQTIPYYPSTYTNGGFVDPVKGYDGNETSSASGTVTGDVGASASAYLIYSGWPTPAGTPTAMTLKVMTALGFSGTGTGSLSYSLNNGSTWTTVYSSTAARVQQYSNITLSATQDITQVKVRVDIEADPTVVYDGGGEDPPAGFPSGHGPLPIQGGGGGTYDDNTAALSVYEVRIDVTT